LFTFGAAARGHAQRSEATTVDGVECRQAVALDVDNSCMDKSDLPDLAQRDRSQ